jgi:hypothetical protein
MFVKTGACVRIPEQRTESEAIARKLWVVHDDIGTAELVLTYRNALRNTSTGAFSTQERYLVSARIRCECGCGQSDVLPTSKSGERCVCVWGGGGGGAKE